MAFLLPPQEAAKEVFGVLAVSFADRQYPKPPICESCVQAKIWRNWMGLAAQAHIPRFMLEDLIQPVKNDQVNQAQVVQLAVNVRPLRGRIPSIS